MYKKLDVDFELPEILERSINEMLHNLNYEKGSLADCYQEDIRNTLNGCDCCMEEDQIELLRNYYCRGGIYGSENN